MAGTDLSRPCYWRLCLEAVCQHIRSKISASIIERRYDREGHSITALG